MAYAGTVLMKFHAFDQNPLMCRVLLIHYFFQRQFQCLAEQNGQVVARSDWTAPLTVYYGPKDVDIEIASLNATLNETDIFVGDQVRLKCNAKSNPLSSFEWIFVDADNQTKPTLEHWSTDGKCCILTLMANILL